MSESLDFTSLGRLVERKCPWRNTIGGILFQKNFQNGYEYGGGTREGGRQFHQRRPETLAGAHCFFDRIRPDADNFWVRSESDASFPRLRALTCDETNQTNSQALGPDTWTIGDTWLYRNHYHRLGSQCKAERDNAKRVRPG